MRPERTVAHPRASLPAMTDEADLRRLLAGCDDAQRRAITSDAAPLLVVAGAGSGKTRVLTRRVARRVLDGSADAAHVLALTFTRRAAGELRSRLQALGLVEPVAAGTFHAVALRELRRIAADRGDRPPVVLDSKVRLLAALSPSRSDVLSSIASEIEWAKARCGGPDGYVTAAASAGRSASVGAARVAELYARYEQEKRRRHVLDFDDLLSTLAAAIEQDRDVATSQRWRHRHLFVDELQDANASQLRLLDGWLGGRSDLCAVGDPQQSIYGWNGAEPAVLERFATRFPGSVVLRLDANHRSSPQVVAVASAALGRTERGDVLTSRADGPIPTVTCYADDAAECAGVVAAVRRTRRPGRRWACCAVLARTNAQLDGFEAAFDAAGIPSRNSAGARLLARADVRAVLESAADRSSSAAFAALVDDLDLDLRAMTTSGAPGSGVTAAGRDAMGALAELAHEYRAEDTTPTVDGFVAWARATLRSDPAAGTSDAVVLSTFHRAKGLEWPVVFVTGLEDGLVPHASALSPEALDEERRLLYVALSRAGEELHCSWSLQRAFGARKVERHPSPYLRAVEAAREALERLARPDRDASRRAVAESRALLRAARDGG